MLQTHLGVRFISGSDDPARRDTPLAELGRRVDIGTRLRSAVSLGDVTGIQELAHDLMNGDVAEVAIGERINRLAMNFDFDGLSELADSLAT
jgi:hypothetical protein